MVIALKLKIDYLPHNRLIQRRAFAQTIKSPFDRLSVSSNKMAEFYPYFRSILSDESLSDAVEGKREDGEGDGAERCLMSDARTDCRSSQKLPKDHN